MKKLITLFLLLFSFGLVSGQNFTYPTIKNTGEELTEFIPAGWEILKTAKGDLNNDRAEDIAFVIQKNDSVNLIEKTLEFSDTVLAQPRILIIAFKDKTSDNFKLIEQSNSLIIPHSDSTMEDPFQTLKIEDGILQIGFHIFFNMGSWYITNLTYNFEYLNEEFKLINAEHFEFHRANHNYSKYNFDFINKKWVLEKGNDNVEEEPVIQTHQMNIDKMKSLKAIGQPKTWEIAKDVYI